MYKNREFTVLIDSATKKPMMIHDENYVIYSRKPVKKLKDSVESVPNEWRNKTPDFIPVDIDGNEGIYNVHSEKVHLISEIQKSVSRMSVAERFNYRQKLIDELYNPFNDYDDLGSGEYVHHGLGSSVIDGQWHTFTRDLQTDLGDAQPGVTILEVNGFLIRGSGKVDSIGLAT